MCQMAIRDIFYSAVILLHQQEPPTLPSTPADATPSPNPQLSHSRMRIHALLHYGTKPGQFETSKIHFPTSEGVSEVSERVSE